MPLHIQEYVDIKKYSSFSMGSTIRWFAEVYSKNDIEQAMSFSKNINVPLVILGKGCNTIFSDSTDCLEVFVLHMKNMGISIISEDTDSIYANVQAGEDWDSFVEYTTSRNISGIEALSLIPSSVGATPVQNVGAYGQEVCQTIQSVHAYDCKEHIWKDIQNEECNFSYRSSIFKHEDKGRYIIESVNFKLSKKSAYVPAHVELQKYITENDLTCSPQDIRKAVIAIRTKKLPDPSIVPNCGSFFENVILTPEELLPILKTYPNIPQYPEDDGRIKISTGWMIDACGLKGYSLGHVSVSPTNALVLLHDGMGTYAELHRLESHIIQKVKETFGVSIEREPNIIY